MSISLGNGWVNDAEGQKIPIWAGEFHYFRNRREDWPRIVRNMKDAGLTVLTTFVQPNWHEYEPGKFDFEGKTAPERDLVHLLELANEIGIYVHLRLGPACCEWRESGGTSFGTRWRVISDAFWDAVEKHQADKGGSLLLYQIHNEWFHPLGMYYILLPVIAGFDGFRAQSVPFWLELCGTNPHYIASGYEFSMDYLPKYLASLYPDAAAMNSAWGTDYESFDAVRGELAADGVSTLHDLIVHCRETFRRFRYPGDSPRRVVDLLNWMIYYTAAPLAEDVEHTRARTSLPVTHNWAMGDERKWSKMAGLDLAGYDVYAPMSIDIWEWSKITYDMQSSPFPLSNEFMCGTIDRYLWGGQGFYTDSFARMEILSCIMGGMKGVNLYMFVERDNWLQCPLDERGGKRSCYEAISSIFKALRQNKWHETSMARDLGVFKHTAYHRYADGGGDGLFDEGYKDDYLRDGLYKGHEAKRHFVAAFRALHDSSIDFEVFKDTRGGETIAGFKTILAYSMWFIDRGAANDLLSFVEAGGSLVLYPCVPTHADDGRELDVFTKKLGLEPFAPEQDAACRIDLADVDLDSVMPASSGDFRTADGRLWAQVRSYGRGKVLALNFEPSSSPEALERVVTLWGGCRKYVDTGLPLTDGGMGVHPSGFAVVAMVNGSNDEVLRGLTVDVSKLPESEVYAVTDELGGSLIGSFAPSDGKIRVPLQLAPREGALLRVSPEASNASPRVEAKASVTSLADWHARREDEAEYERRYLGPDLDDSWASVPVQEWTLPALASGKVLGVQGWFYLKQNVTLPSTGGPVRLHIRPNGYHNMGIAYVNGVECGRFAIERPGAESFFDVTSLVRAGEQNTLAIRLYRQSLDCHDRGVSGFDMLRFECAGEVVDVDHLYLRQERRDFGEAAGWPASDTADNGWEPLSLPVEITMDRTGDALWLRTDVQVKNPESARLRLQGNNCVVTVFANGDYVVKTPALPCELPMDGFLKDGVNKLALRITPDNFENYAIPHKKRYDSYIRNGFLPLQMKLDGVEMVT